MITIPDNDDERILRRVKLDGYGYTLTTWDTYRQARTGQCLLGYAFYKEGEIEPIFVGEDFGCSPMDPVDSDAALRSILGFLTLRPGDTDADYFAEYNERQLAFAASEAEELSLWGMDARDLESVDPLAFVDIE